MGNDENKKNRCWFIQNWIALAALIISIIALVHTHLAYDLQTQLSHLHMEPIIKTSFDLPSNKNPVFVVFNEGNVPAVSVSCGYCVFTFNKGQKKIETAAKGGRVFSPGVIYKESLKSTEYASMDLLGVQPVKNILVIYQFDLVYFREQDMKQFLRKEYYFVDNGQVIVQSKFRHNPLYRDVMYQISQTVIPDPSWAPGMLKTYLDNQKVTQELPNGALEK